MAELEKVCQHLPMKSSVDMQEDIGVGWEHNWCYKLDYGNKNF